MPMRTDQFVRLRIICLVALHYTAFSVQRLRRQHRKSEAFMGAAETLIFLVAFVVILAAYAMGRYGGRLSRRRGNEQHQAGGRTSPVEVLLEYRNAKCFTTRRKAVILGYVPRRGGRSCLFAICNNGTAPRTFRIDRIVSIATLDGELLDTQQFLAERLGVRA